MSTDQFDLDNLLFEMILSIDSLAVETKQYVLINYCFFIIYFDSNHPSGQEMLFHCGFDFYFLSY